MIATKFLIKFEFLILNLNTQVSDSEDSRRAMLQKSGKTEGWLKVEKLCGKKAPETKI
jgi:hypothetical protein